MKKNLAAVIVFILLFSTHVFALAKDMQYVKLGIKMHKTGQYEKAIISYEKAIEINSDNPYAYQYTGEAYLKLGEKELAIENLQRAYDIKPTPALKKRLEGLMDFTRGEGRFFMYPISFDVLIGAAGDSAANIGTVRSFTELLKYAGFVNYNFFTWLGVRGGLMGGPGVIDVPVMARLSFQVISGSYSYSNKGSEFDRGLYMMTGINFGGYLNLDGYGVSGIAPGMIIGIDGRMFFGSWAISSMGYYQYNSTGSSISRMAIGWLLGVAF